MTTEQYQMGYEAGYSDGFDAGAAPVQPAAPRELSDEQIRAIYDRVDWSVIGSTLVFARAVLAAGRKPAECKNNCASCECKDDLK